ncbi:carboxypeptidase-like regulatory domain-containing protein [Flavobacterium alkalisoli]|uniref:Carboxypeptidase-like regulatory domain-containing protein n=1 Tax=Flavobacterium alkalisoli TaxID=2602769 RepID=A0A5B9FVS3_9FLAO|nr:carboxypeptidase-like regulatory domain-containing protein [Flavobacterium alkalisoli]QEE51074.1 carboxypeptidase-like regulatory domain-containing protein [Flavobacterium alkalisoli]
MLKNLFTCLTILLGIQTVLSQNITAKIIDSETGESLSYANVQIDGEDSVVSNSEGYFSIPPKNNDEKTTLTVSFLGYYTENLTVGELKNINFLIKMRPGTFELETVYISNTEIDAYSIMASVRKNLKANYTDSGKPTKNTVFFRESTVIRPKQVKLEMTQATGYSKQQIKDANKELDEFAAKMINYPPKQFTDRLYNYYTSTKIHKEKPVPVQKLEVVKAVKFKDANRSVTLDDMEKLGAQVLFKHLDATKHYRIKSGLIGVRDTIVSNNSFVTDSEYRELEDAEKKTNQKAARSYNWTFLYRTNILINGRFDFINSSELSELYEYSYAGVAESDDKNNRIFIIKFRPNKRRAKYTGTLYVSEKDYAIVRADYTLVEGKKLSGINLKLILGIKQAENFDKGTLVYKKRESGEYYLQYASQENGQYIYINRPLKFIEITEGDKDKVGFDFKAEMDEFEKEEYFVMSESAITEGDYEAAQEPEFDYMQLGSYDPSVWKEYTTIEPLNEMKQFKSVE